MNNNILIIVNTINTVLTMPSLDESSELILRDPRLTNDVTYSNLKKKHKIHIHMYICTYITRV